jgi:N-sulfoglucosamine sulfohydrolase
LLDELKAQEDPRVFGNGHIFDEYPNAVERARNFYERFLRGEVGPAGWINESDIEKKPLE